MGINFFKVFERFIGLKLKSLVGLKLSLITQANTNTEAGAGFTVGVLLQRLRLRLLMITNKKPHKNIEHKPRKQRPPPPGFNVTREPDQEAFCSGCVTNGLGPSRLHRLRLCLRPLPFHESQTAYATPRPRYFHSFPQNAVTRAPRPDVTNVQEPPRLPPSPASTSRLGHGQVRATQGPPPRRLPILPQIPDEMGRQRPVCAYYCLLPTYSLLSLLDLVLTNTAPPGTRT